jgi:hypothetical protein
VILPILAPDGHRRARSLFRKKQGRFGRAVAAAYDQCFPANIWIRLDKAMMNFWQVFAGNVKAPRKLHRAHRKKHVASVIGFLLRASVDASTVRANVEAICLRLHARDFLACVYAQIAIENEMNVMRK